MMQERSHLPSQAGGQGQGYTRPDAAVDSVITSPPYDNRLADKFDDGDTARMQYFLAGAEHPGNVGNERGDAYWKSMSRIYQECLRILKPAGVMVLVLKGFTRDGKYIDLPTQTAEVCEALGFKQFDHWRRELWNLSFWRILQQRRDPEAFDDRLRYEEVLAFRKGEDGGGSVDSVVTSPPYEASDMKSPVDNQGNHQVVRKMSTQTLGYTRKGVDVVLTSPPYEGSIQGTPGIDWSKTATGRDMTIEPAQATRVASLGGYTRRVDAIISSPPYEGSLSGPEPSGKLFETERRHNSPASGNRKSKRKPMGHGYSNG